MHTDDTRPHRGEVIEVEGKHVGSPGCTGEIVGAPDARIRVGPEH